MFLKNRNISSKIKRSKVTDYAALIIFLSPCVCLSLFCSVFFGIFLMIQSVGLLSVIVKFNDHTHLFSTVICFKTPVSDT